MIRASAIRSAPRDCHPERSLAVSKANRQTQPKDPVFASSATTDTGRTSLTGTARSALTFLFALLIATQMLPAQVSAKFPGSKAKLASPDGRYVIQNVEQEQEPRHVLLLKEMATGSSRKVYEYGRGASAVWSPDSRHFAINDYAGSDYTKTSIFSAYEPDQKIDVQEAIFSYDKRMQKRVTLAGWGHDYFGVVRWLDAQRVVVRHWGHNDEPPLGAFCECYIFSLRGSVAHCSHQPKSDDPETLCGDTTP